jgi:hypothetical protein
MEMKLSSWFSSKRSRLHGKNVSVHHFVEELASNDEHSAVTLYFDGQHCPIAGTIYRLTDHGVSLTHDVPIEPKEATIRISSSHGGTLCARLQIVWCREGWARGCYRSACRFLRVYEEDPLDSLAST